MKKINLRLLTWLQYPLVLLIGFMVTSITHTTLTGDLVTLGLFAGLWIFRWWRQARRRVEQQPRNLLTRRLAAQIDSELTKTLATANYTILSLEAWPASKMAAWPETPQAPAPLMAFDITLLVHDGSRGVERLTVYVDTLLYTLPAADSDDQESSLALSPVSRVCPFCPHGTLHVQREHNDAPYQIRRYYTWQCDNPHCRYQDCADILGNQKSHEQAQERSS